MCQSTVLSQAGTRDLSPHAHILYIHCIDNKDIRVYPPKKGDLAMTATASINLRISNEEKALIDQAAQSMGKSRTAFILENTLKIAEEVLLDRTRFTIDSKHWEQLTTALDNQPSEDQIQGLSKLFTDKTPWQKQ
jgi:uncharacterized protein (DUF1778 family)